MINRRDFIKQLAGVRIAVTIPNLLFFTNGGAEKEESSFI